MVGIIIGILNLGIEVDARNRRCSTFLVFCNWLVLKSIRQR